MNELLLNQLRGIASRYPEIESVLLFGSRAHGDCNHLSDIDIAIKAPNIPQKDWLLLTEQIENELDTLLKIDLVLYDRVSEELRVQIDQCYQVLYR
ncbi:nucleotidyltransferase domain-containing protein [Psychrobacillus sp. L4]|uniref:nucleotidyltransferase domain-containing protein n=1 Tax=Psychrobacillus sp. L4 TaxID=3236892 RepID=UPI0036F3045C